MRVRNLGRKGTEEVIEKMQEFESEMEEDFISVIFFLVTEKKQYIIISDILKKKL